MKSITILSLCLTLLMAVRLLAWTERDREIEAEQAALWEDRFAASEQLPNEAKLEALRRGLINMGYRRRNSDQSPSVDNIFDKIQTTMLSIPGHARYFADEIEAEREKIKDLPSKDYRRGEYNLKRSENLKSILVLLKSPETIAVLGNYLYDERDPPPPSLPTQDVTSIPPNSEIAAEVLEQIGLRDYPYRAKNDFGNANAVAKNRAWWEEIKSGKKALSFKGQNVEYRFKPDGTWDTITLANPPDDGSKAPTANQKKPEREEIRPPRTIETKKTKTSGNVWAWVIGSVTFLLAILVWLRGKK